MCLENPEFFPFLDPGRRQRRDLQRRQQPHQGWLQRWKLNSNIGRNDKDDGNDDDGNGNDDDGNNDGNDINGDDVGIIFPRRQNCFSILGLV